MANKSSSLKLLFIPLGLGLFFAGLNFLPAWHDLEFGIYDLFLRLKPEIKEDPSIVLLDVDDEAIVRSGSWPWPRGLMAQGLEALTEFNARYAVFDIEYLERSPRSVDQNYLDTTLQSSFNTDFYEIQSSVAELFGAVASQTIPVSSLGTYADDLAALVSGIGKELYNKTLLVSVENDSYLGKAMRLFGSSFVTLNLQKTLVLTTPPELRNLAHERFAYTNVRDQNFISEANKDFLVPIPEVTSMAAGAGFTNVKIDSDGKRRRIQLLNSVRGDIFLQLSFSPFTHSLGNPEFTASPGRIHVKNAQVSQGATEFNIPLDSEGMMLINWPKKDFLDSFRHVSFYRLVEYKEYERELMIGLTSLASNEAWRLYSGENPVLKVLELWKISETARLTGLETGEPADRAAFIKTREAFYKSISTLAASPVDQQLIKLLEAAQKDAPADISKLYATTAKNIATHFSNFRDLTIKLTSARSDLLSKLHGTTCMIGWTGIGSTDFGVNPFAEQYANVGTHASVLNTILQQKFISPAPIWLSSLLALGLPLGLIFAIRRFRTGIQITAGVGATVFFFVLSFGLFATTGIYITLLAPLLAIVMSFFGFTLTVFFLSEKEKSFLRKAFSTYLSGDVINQIVNDPSLLKLGGQKKWISAMFTDVRGFSTISEQLDPEQLVRLLNLYLSGMSDIILDNRGTIDKFEGDAIISFFGAPVSYDTHAKAICLSAIRMKEKEAALNVHFLAEKLTPHPLVTRIGINTGDMVVGNMGTEKKMDYTIMGNAVNLAARLEGVNKQYGSWILATETTKNEAGDEFAWRRLDRVRVVGINQPLRLYELIGLKSELSAQQTQLLQDFDAALDTFELRDWTKAAAAFASLAAVHVHDGPSKTYLKRSNDFISNPPAPDWEGVFNLTEK